MHVDILVAEIGSTTTMVNAFDGVVENGDSNTDFPESNNHASVSGDSVRGNGRRGGSGSGSSLVINR